MTICSGKKIAAYLNDISGTFDKVYKPYLLAKLNAAGIGPIFLNFLDAYLAPRQGKVIVQGESSEMFAIEDSVYQGTVLGPPLWNAFFADVAKAANANGGKEAMFADDLNVFKTFHRQTPLPQMMKDLEECRHKVHKWGKMNRVSFDPGKEHLVVIHPAEHHGESFKLLGLMIDLNLRMHTAIDQLLAKIRPRSTAILRTRGYYSVPDLINQYKTQIWGLVEAHCGGYFHAATTLLEKIEGVQQNFLKQLNVSTSDAFIEFNFAPSMLRRNIGVLGLIHKRVLGLCHPAFEDLLPWYEHRISIPRGFGHNKQLYDHRLEVSHQRALFDKSIFAMVDIYNNLPQSLVDSPTVKVFQRGLTHIAKERCKKGDPEWHLSFNRRTGPDIDGCSITI